jgi:ammonium transporter
VETPVLRFALSALVAVVLSFTFANTTIADEPQKATEPDPAKTPAMFKDVNDAKGEATDAAHKYSDIAWLLTSSALVLFMMPGLALFYGGMARRKNILGTMMQTMIALGIVGVQWVVVGYSLSFGESAAKVKFPGTDTPASLIGFSKELLFLGKDAAVGTGDKNAKDILKSQGLDPEKATKEQTEKAEAEVTKKNRFRAFPNTKVPLYLHVMFQGMFAIITVALVSGAFAERVKFGAYCLFMVIWTTIVYDPIAHWVWAFDWVKAKPDDATFPASGIMGANGAIDFAGGTVVHIAAGFSGLAAILLLRKRVGYGKQTFHPNSMVLTLLGAGMLWFGWFGFNGGSALASNGLAISAFTVTQIAAAAAGLTWTLTEWALKGKPTALGFASGVVAGLVAITPASGFVAPGGALVIGLVAGLACYGAVLLKPVLGYDDTLDAFGVHGVGGLIGAILTGALVSLPLWAYGAELKPGDFPGKLNDAKDAVDIAAQLQWQVIAALTSAVYAFVVTSILVLLIDNTIGFTVDPKEEAEGLDLTQHGEAGFDYGGAAIEEVTGAIVAEPKSASVPPNGPTRKRFTVVVEGVAPKDLIKAWSDLCQPHEEPPSPAFAAVYPHVTTVSGNRFRFRGGDPVILRAELQRLFTDALDLAVKTHVESE